MINGRVYDIECLKLMFCVIFYDYQKNEFQEFEISKYQNDLYSLVKYLEDRDFEYMIGFNNVNYDMQVIQFILNNYNSWYELTGDQIAAKLSKFSGRVIELTNFGQFPPFRESEFSVRQIDLFKIHHFDNENRRTSLKWLQYMMNWWNVEEMPYHFLDETLTRDQLLEIKDYCKNDVLSTYLFFKYTIGEVEHANYKGKNKISDRLNLIEEGLLPEEAINYSDSKIGDEMNKRAYCKLTGKKISDLYLLKKNRGGTKPFTYGEAIPKYIQFKTKELRDFHDKIKKVRVSLKQTDKQGFPLTFRGTTYVIARGGIHSTESHRIIIPRDNEILEDADVGLNAVQLKFFKLTGTSLELCTLS